MDAPNTEKRGRRLALLAAGGVLAGGAALGALGVAAANAAPLLTAASPSASASSETESKHGNETAVTGAKAATLQAAALKAVPGATVERIETDADGAAYEVHLKKSDGSEVTVKFDSALKQTGIETGRGSGDGHHGGRHGDETAVTGAKAATLQAAALKAVPGATVERIETDADGAAYEVHLKKADGSEVTVKFDGALKQTGIETGHGSDTEGGSGS